MRVSIDTLSRVGFPGIPGPVSRPGKPVEILDTCRAFMRVSIDALSRVGFPGSLARGIGINLAAVRMEVNPVEILDTCRAFMRVSIDALSRVVFPGIPGPVNRPGRAG
jgi:hypothetical protein